ncbi:MAG: hypothetical protein IJE77_11915, partial [Thermoguttaceae bacterium]|nr:hypothetical protein [Thermoguttaceae bacterium]
HKTEENASSISNAPSPQTAPPSQTNAGLSPEATECDALTTCATTVEPDRSFYFTESTESARFSQAALPSPFTSSTLRDAEVQGALPAPPSADFPPETPAKSRRSNAPRLAILQRFVKLVAQTRRADVPAPPSNAPSDFGENVAFVVSPTDSFGQTAQSSDASFPFIADAFEPAPQDYFSYF